MVKLTTESKNFLQDWILNFLSSPNQVFGGLPPCPYAKRAYLDNRVQIVETNNYLLDITTCIDTWTNNFDVVIFVCSDTVDPNTFLQDTEYLNKIFLSKDFVILDDHKDILEEVQGVKLNNGKYNLLLVQRRSLLNDAAKKLENTDYYKNWPKDYYDDVVSWRI